MVVSDLVRLVFSWELSGLMFLRFHEFEALGKYRVGGRYVVEYGVDTWFGELFLRRVYGVYLCARSLPVVGGGVNVIYERGVPCGDFPQFVRVGRFVSG